MTDPTMRKPVIGLMGAPGSGKSLVAEQLAELGCAVIDADAIAKAQLDDPEVSDTLVQWWGEAVLTAEGKVNRKAVGRIVFGDKQQLTRLESLLHPRVHAERRRLRTEHQRDPAVKAIVEDCPLLLESHISADCDTLVFVDAPRETRLQRVMKQRGWTEAELDRREKNQMPLDRKRRRADHVIKNDAGVEQTLRHVRRVFSLIIPEPV